MQRGIACTILRGGSSRGLYFQAADLPTDAPQRNRLLARALGSPDERQIDGLGGAHPLTSKVAIVGPPSRADADVDYLFLQVTPATGAVSDAQNCGNILAGVAPFAVESAMVPAGPEATDVRIHMVNSGSLCVARLETPGGQVRYDGAAAIDGVPGTAAPVMLAFQDTAGASCGELLPTGSSLDVVDGIEVSVVDNGMPVVMLRAEDLGKTGYETPAELEQDESLKRRLEAIRLALGPRVNLGDVTEKTVPKMCLLAGPRAGGTISTRTFIPHRVHQSLGVLGAVSVATACRIPGTVASELAAPVQAGQSLMQIEHPSGALAVELELESLDPVRIGRAALLRTARKLMAGEVFVPSEFWPSES